METIRLYENTYSDTKGFIIYNQNEEPRRFIIPSGVISASENGLLSVSDYQSLNLSVNTSAEGKLKDLVYGSVSGVYYNSEAQAVRGFTFYNRISLTEVSFPECKFVDYYAFAYCSGLQKADFATCSLISYAAFQSCINLSTISFPQCEYISAYAFAYCLQLTEALFPMCSRINANAFLNCTGLQLISFPQCSLLLSSAFCRCSSLTTIIFKNGTCKFSGATVFQSCYRLMSVYLLGGERYTLAAITTFAATPISNYTTYTGGVHGSIFVPVSLYNSYITSTNWVNFSSRFVSLTDAEIEALGF